MMDLQDAPRAEPSGAAPRPVAGGEARLISEDGVLTPDEPPILYELWDGGDDISGGWVEIYTQPDADPIRLDASFIKGLGFSIDEHIGPTEIQEELGVGIGGNELTMVVRQDWPFAVVIPVVLGVALLVASLVALVRSRRRVRALQTIARHEIASREAERGRVAREIHDGPLQEIAALARSAGDAPGASADSLRAVAGELRALATGLRPPALDRFGLMPALDDLAERWTMAPHPLTVRLSADAGWQDAIEAAPERRAELELAFYRVAQEALANASEHGRARTAWIFLRTDEAGLELTVRDDGGGLREGVALDRATTQALVASGHFGLVGMRERAHAVGGEFAVGPGPGGSGVEVRLRIPPPARTRRPTAALRPRSPAHA